MSTVRDLIYDALQKINVVGVGQNLNAEDEQSAFRTLNDILESWSVEGGLVFNQTEDTFNLVNNQQSYTVGPGGDFDTTKPFEIKALYTTIGTTTYTATQYGEADWASIVDKNDSTGIPEVYFYNNNEPLADIRFYPIPTSVSTVTILSRKAITAFANVNESLALPPGYRRALVHNLAVEEAPNYEKEASNTVKSIAKKSKSNVFSYNARNRKTRSNPTSAIMISNRDDDRFNIYTGQYE